MTLRRGQGIQRLALVGSGSSRLWGLLGVALLLVGCTSQPATAPAIDTTVTHTQTLTRPAPGGIPLRVALQDVPPWPPSQAAPRGEQERSCPYLKAGLNIEPDPNGIDFADLEGNRVQRVAVLTTLKPIGCRFYFQNDYHPVGDILPSTYPTPTEARNAMIATATAGRDANTVRSFLPGIDGISFRTRLSAPDKGQDWAFAFAKDDHMVVIRTDQNQATPANAVYIAQAIAHDF